MNHIEILVGFGLFMTGYLLKRVDRCDDNLNQHEREKHNKKETQ